ncbi:thioesterase family protein [Qaidamihabitans albus]|uniref:thioesterase family protein n=1 Tax=Qaidamihabitans albus TaxID=2795733 RepID=UPI0018F160FF|nr:thioesterase family protein [Qaidamihabitans albus]
MTDCFYHAEGSDVFEPTTATCGPWDPRIQHAGPPTALLVDAIERQYAGDERFTARLKVEIQRPVPVERVRVRIESIRGGRRTELVGGELSTVDGTILLSCTAWRFSQADVSLPEAASALGEDTPMPRPEDLTGTDTPFFDIPHEEGYHTAMEWRFAKGGWRDPGPAFVWLRMRHPLVDDREPSPMQRLVVAADSVSGAAAALDPARYAFPNVDLTVRLLREPVGEWIGFDATAQYSARGAGWAAAEVYDDQGLTGASAQTLLVADR